MLRAKRSVATNTVTDADCIDGPGFEDHMRAWSHTGSLNATPLTSNWHVKPQSVFQVPKKQEVVSLETTGIG